MPLQSFLYSSHRSPRFYSVSTARKGIPAPDKKTLEFYMLSGIMKKEIFRLSGSSIQPIEGALNAAKGVQSLFFI